MSYNGKTKEVSVTRNFESGKMISSATKIKLQLFPVDENTRIGLEKDAYCPFLELTLSPRKKISSVLKHIMTKWGKSSIAVGEPRLLSCRFEKFNLTSQKVWTLDDTRTCAIDVFEALGRPSIFRLWCQPYPCASAAIPALGSLPEARDSCSDYYENTYAKQKENQTTDVSSLMSAGKVASLCENNLFGASNYSVDEDVKADCDAEKKLLLWFDSCSNISIGGLLSDVSLQGKFNTKSKPEDSMLKPKQVTSDMDGFAASTVSSQHHIPPSILDAEDACSSFSFRKLFCSGNYVPSVDDILNTKSHASSSAQVAGQLGYPKSNDCQEEKPSLTLSSVVTNDERSLGLRSIKWTDSWGPFDLVAPHLGH
uniref:TSL-kinase interacting protein 1 n=1 Tax=Kalanchoe fedtschenkoi TaxID=63787 RepID=A0A7N0V0X4_KALFE